MKSALLFPGQGAQRVGMGVASAERCPAAAALFERASRVLGWDLLAACREGPSERLNRTDVSQPALLAASLADLEALRAAEPETVARAGAAAGLSLGEITALCFAGALRFEDAVRLVAERGAAMQAACDARPGGMLSLLGASEAAAAEVAAAAGAAGIVVLANVNAADQTVLSGEAPALEAARREARARGIRAIPLRVAGAFHSPLMAGAAERLREVLREIPFSRPVLPVVSNVTAAFYGEGDDPRDLLARQVVSPVRWHPSMRLLVEGGFAAFREVGPGKVLTGLLRGFAGVCAAPTDGGGA